MSLEDIKNGIYSAGKYVSENATLATSIANIKLNLKTKEDLLQKEYAELGKKYFDKTKKKTGEDFSKIVELQNEIDKLNEELSSLKGTKVCSNCGSKQIKGNTFCSECGSKIN